MMTVGSRSDTSDERQLSYFSIFHFALLLDGRAISASSHGLMDMTFCFCFCSLAFDFSFLISNRTCALDEEARQHKIAYSGV